MKLSEVFRKKVYEATGGKIDAPKGRGRKPDYIKEMEDYVKAQKKIEKASKPKAQAKSKAQTKTKAQTKPKAQTKAQAELKEIGRQLTSNRAAKVPRKRSAAQINKEIEAKSPNLPTNPDLKAVETGKKVANARKKVAKTAKPLPNVVKTKSNSANSENCYIVRLQTGNGNVSEKKFTSKSSAKRKFNSMLKSMQGQGAKFEMKSVLDNRDGTHAKSTNMNASLKMLLMPCDVEPVNIIMGGGRPANPNSQWV